MKVIVSYDISDDKRRNKISRELLNWGKRVQYSVFECELEPEKIYRMKRRLEYILEDEDSLRVYVLCADCSKKTEIYGPEPEEIPETDVIFI